MILGFSKKFPWGEPTHFVEKITSGKKIHTVRVDKHKRWRQGMDVHFATGTRTPDYNNFMTGVCTGVQNIEIRYDDSGAKGEWYSPIIVIDGNRLNLALAMGFIKLDGFSSLDEFKKWFNDDFEGRLIHWTDLRY